MRFENQSESIISISWSHQFSYIISCIALYIHVYTYTYIKAYTGKKKKGVIKTGHEVGRAWDPSRYGGAQRVNNCDATFGYFLLYNTGSTYDDEIAKVAENYSHGEGSRGGQASGSGAGV